MDNVDNFVYKLFSPKNRVFSMWITFEYFSPSTFLTFPQTGNRGLKFGKIWLFCQLSNFRVFYCQNLQEIFFFKLFELFIHFKNVKLLITRRLFHVLDIIPSRCNGICTICYCSHNLAQLLCTNITCYEKSSEIRFSVFSRNYIALLI